MPDFAAIRIVIFQVADLVCALPVEQVREIIPSQAATRIPGAPEAVNGLVNVRGSLITVISGHQLLSRSDSPVGADACVLVIVLGGHVVGLEVDAVLDLADVPTSELEPREVLPGLDPRIAKSAGRHAERAFVLLDTEALLTPLIGG
ncbi:MAG: chemotaxis protein CheW [Gemmatimonadota bacterium]